MAFLLVLFYPLKGQEAKNSISGGVLYSQFIGKHPKGQKDSYYNLLPGFGVEFNYFKKLSSVFSIGTGLNFKQCNFTSRLEYPHLYSWSDIDYARKFNNLELSVPFFLRFFRQNSKISLFMTTGIYVGEIVSLNSKYPTSVGWIEWPHVETIPFYEKNNFYSDIYVDIGTKIKLSDKSNVLISPYLSYRRKGWVTNFHNKYYFGLKISYQINC